MTRVALLASGPSLNLYPGRSAFDCVIAVNRAVLSEHGADYWSIGDAENFYRYAPLLTTIPRIWTHRDTARRLNMIGFALVYQRSEREQWSIFSATAGLKLAIDLGAEQIDCFGVDMAGQLNFDGTQEAGADRSEARWMRERAAWDELALCGRVIRHGHS